MLASTIPYGLSGSRPQKTPGPPFAWKGAWPCSQYPKGGLTPPLLANAGAAITATIATMTAINERTIMKRFTSGTSFMHA
jgi:hypothetical protein